jgi:hypothetical protein
MKFVTLLVLATVLVGCGKKTSEQKETFTNLSSANTTIGDMGMQINLGTLRTAVGEHIIVSCKDEDTKAPNTDNRDRAEALKQYKDGLAGGGEAIFSSGRRVDMIEVEIALSLAILELEKDLAGTECPAEVLGKSRL